MFERAQHRDSRCHRHIALSDQILQEDALPCIELRNLRHLRKIQLRQPASRVPVSGHRRQCDRFPLSGRHLRQRPQRFQIMLQIILLFRGQIFVRIHRLPDPDLTLMQIGVDHIHLLSA